MDHSLQQTMLLSSSATSLAFSVYESWLYHPEFDQQWQTQTISYLYKQHQRQVRLVLTKINQRGCRLLLFIGNNSILSNLPPPVNKWFDFQRVLIKANSMLEEITFQIECQGTP